jgi:hypothetical protein
VIVKEAGASSAFDALVKIKSMKKHIDNSACAFRATEQADNRKIIMLSDKIDQARAKRARTASRNANHRTALLARMMTRQKGEVK